MVINYEIAKNMLLTSDTKGCQRFFAENNCFLELGYCALLDDDLEKASKIFKSISEGNIRAHWAAFMVDMINNKFKGYPSYFEIRNFLEIDMNILLQAYKGEYIEKLCGYADFFFTINPEAFKYFGRVFLNNSLDEYGMFFLKRAKDNFYNDPELHYMLGEYYYNKNEKVAAAQALDTCLRILPKYFPAENLLKKIRLGV